jgi:hypothetical protein
VGEANPAAAVVADAGGGADPVVSPKSGELLFAEAGEPKEFWYEPSIGYIMFEAKFPEEYEKRVIGFLDKYLSTN